MWRGLARLGVFGAQAKENEDRRFADEELKAKKEKEKKEKEKEEIPPWGPPHSEFCVNSKK